MERLGRLLALLPMHGALILDFVNLVAEQVGKRLPDNRLILVNVLE